MTHDEHRARHQELHRMLDELYADYLRHNLKPILDDEDQAFFPVSVDRLMKWSFEQTLDPDELEEK